MNFYTLCITTAGHDASYALFNHDKLILFSQGERGTRKKNDDDISAEFFDYIKDKITNDIDLLIIHPVGKNKERIYYDVKKRFNIKKVIQKELLDKFNNVVIKNELEFSHHITHALSPFYTSPFDEAVCLIIDALGSRFGLSVHYGTGIIGSETTTIVEINKRFEPKVLYKRMQYVPATSHDTVNSMLSFSFTGGLCDDNFFNDEVKFEADLTTHMDIGNMYHTISEHLGFGIFGCGKVMGLSAYGNPTNDLPPFLFEDTIYSNNNFFSLDRTINKCCYPKLYERLSFQQKADLAYNVQKAMEKVFISHAEFIKNNSKIRNLVIGGGCALNILSISAIKEKYPEFNIYVDPIANDATHSIGLGIHCYKHYVNKMIEKKNHVNSIYMGPEYDLSFIESKVDSFVNKNS